MVIAEDIVLFSLQTIPFIWFEMHFSDLVNIKYYVRQYRYKISIFLKCVICSR